MSKDKPKTVITGQAKDSFESDSHQMEEVVSKTSQYQLPSSTELRFQRETEVAPNVSYYASYDTENSHLDLVFDFSNVSIEDLTPNKIMKSWKKGFENETVYQLTSTVRHQYNAVYDSLRTQGKNSEEINEIFTDERIPTSKITFKGLSEKDAVTLQELIGGHVIGVSEKEPSEVIRGATWKDYVGPLVAGPALALAAGLGGIALLLGTEVGQVVAEQLDTLEDAVEPSVTYVKDLVGNSEVVGGLKVLGGNISAATDGLYNTLKADGHLDGLIKVGENISGYTTQITEAAAVAQTHLSDATTELNEVLLAEGGVVDQMQGYMDAARTDIGDLKASLADIKQDLTDTYDNIQLEIDKIDGEMDNVGMTYRFDSNPANDMDLFASSDGEGADILYDGDGNAIAYKMNDGSYWNIGSPDPPQFGDGVDSSDFAQDGLSYHYDVTVNGTTSAHFKNVTESLDSITRDQYGGLADAKAGLETTQASVLSISGKTDGAITLTDSAYANVVAVSGDETGNSGVPDGQGGFVDPLLNQTRDSVTSASEDTAAAQGSLDQITDYAGNIDTEVTTLNTYVGDIRTDLDGVNTELGEANTALYGNGTAENPGLITDGESAIASYDAAQADAPEMSGLAKAYNSIPGPVKKIGGGVAIGAAGVATFLRFFSPRTILKKNARRDMALGKSEPYRQFDGPLMQAPEIVYQVG
ncbi:MAG: hypothetical protein GOU98_02380 [Candidatus Altiarchaeota archaeon]|nr:hypothetical protein [Candidatus Altiarchaeota archaeon]